MGSDLRAISLLFTGHMIDLPNRPEPRFPASLVPAVRKEVGAAIERGLSKLRDRSVVLGFASGARGGDILFHEECRAREIDTVIVLPFEPDQFVGTSVEGVPGSDWQQRFWDLWNATSAEHRHVLGLPQTDDAFADCNIVLLDMARQHGLVHLIALWDGKGGDGPGGAADLVSRLRREDDSDIFAPGDLQS